MPILDLRHVAGLVELKWRTAITRHRPCTLLFVGNLPSPYRPARLRLTRSECEKEVRAFYKKRLSQQKIANRKKVSK